MPSFLTLPLRFAFISVWLSLVAVILPVCYGQGRVIWAVNCGGEAHTDSHGIDYEADSLETGFASDHGMSYHIKRVPLGDQLLFQTERYHTSDFSYSLPVPQNGDYVLTLKFSEVWFTKPFEKVFDVMLNKEIVILSGLDIFNHVGFATAHEEHIPITVKDGVAHVGGMSTPLVEGSLSVDFIKGDRDNPKINAIVFTHGRIEDVPKLPALEPDLDDSFTSEPAYEEEQEKESAFKRSRIGSPRTPDPYASTESSYFLLPVLISVGAFLPILFCLCKL